MKNILLHLIFLAVALVCGYSVNAQALVNPAAGGTNLTVTTWATLSDIVITENGTNDDIMQYGSTQTLVLTLPSGYKLNTSAGSVSFVAGKDISAVTLSLNASELTVTITTNAGGKVSGDEIRITGLQVQAAAECPAASTGNIIRTSGNPGTQTILGITNDVTNFGTLSQQVYYNMFQKSFLNNGGNHYAYAVEQTADGGYVTAGYWGIASVPTWGCGAKLDEKGVEQYKFEITGGYAEARSIQQTSDGGFIIAAAYGTFYMQLYKTDNTFNVQWSNAYGDASAFESSPGDVRRTSDGGYIMVGYKGGADVYLVKTGMNGSMEWAASYGNSGDDIGFSVLQRAGGFLVAGTTTSFGAGGLYVLNMDNNGGVLWAKTYSGWSVILGSSVTLETTSDGNYFVAGSRGTPALIKMNGDGNILWAKTYNVYTVGGNCYGGMQTSDGGYILGGYVNWGVSTGELFMVKTNQDGNVEWGTTYGGSRDESTGRYFGGSNCVRQTSDGGYALLGTTRTWGGPAVVYAPAFYLVKTDPKGCSQCNFSYRSIAEAVPSPTVTNVTASTVLVYVGSDLGQSNAMTNSAATDEPNLCEAFVSGGLLPFYLTSFKARTLENSDIVLEWETPPAKNWSGFDIERSTDGKEFVTIGFIPSKENNQGNNYYEFPDLPDEWFTTYYYRLRIQENNSPYFYSYIVEVNRNKEEIMDDFRVMAVFPNPCPRELSDPRINIISQEEGTVELTLCNLTGNTVQKNVYHLTPGRNEIVLHVQKLSSGMYLYRIVFRDQKKTLLVGKGSLNLN